MIRPDTDIETETAFDYCYTTGGDLFLMCEGCPYKDKCSGSEDCDDGK